MKKYTIRPIRGFTLIELLVVISIIAAIAGLTIPVVNGALSHADRTEAINNGKQLHNSLLQFEQDFGSLPSADVRESNPGVFANAPSGDDANAYLAMLIASEILDSEKVFYAKGGSQSAKEPDNIFDTTPRMLEAGENGFSYVMKNNNIPQKMSDKSGRPLLVAALNTEKQEDGIFDREVYKGKAVIVHLDGSASIPRINQEGKAILKGTGKTAFDTGSGTLWGDTQPVIKRPK